MCRSLTLVICVLAASAVPSWANSSIYVRHTQIDNLSYELDCLAGLVRCTRERLPMADQIEPDDVARWRQTARPAAGHHGRSTLPLPTAADLADVSSRHLAGAGPGREIPPPARRVLIDSLLRRTAGTWRRELAPQLARQRIGLETAAQRIELERLLPRLAALYDQSADAPPAVSLIALDSGRDGTLATLGRQVTFVETPIGDPADSRLPVIVHEFVHHWQQGMPEPQRRDMVAAFLAAPGNCAITAYHFFDEAMASAIGNGIVEARLLDAPAFAAYEALPDSYYADSRIDRIAKALRPRVQTLIDTGGRVDADFVTDYVRIASAALGADCARLGSTLHGVSFVLTSPALAEAQQLAQARLAPATAFVDVVTTSGTRTAADRHDALPVVAVATVDALPRLANLVDAATLRNLEATAQARGRAVFATRRATGGQVYLVVGKDVDAAAATLLQLVVLRRDAFTGGWQPPPLPGSVPD